MSELQIGYVTQIYHQMDMKNMRIMIILLLMTKEGGTALIPPGEETAWQSSSSGRPNWRRLCLAPGVKRSMLYWIFSILGELAVNKWMQLRIPMTKLVVF